MGEEHTQRTRDAAPKYVLHVPPERVRAIKVKAHNSTGAGPGAWVTAPDGSALFGRKGEVPARGRVDTHRTSMVLLGGRGCGCGCVAVAIAVAVTVWLWL